MHVSTTRIYRKSLELVAIARDAIAELPPGFGNLADQMRRAAASVTLNYAEGCGKRTKRDRQRYFDTARASAYEVAAALDVAATFGAIDPELAVRGRDVVDHIGAMLHKFL